MRAPDAVATGLGEGTQESRGQAPFKAFYTNLRGTFWDPTRQDRRSLVSGKVLCEV